ncbi:acetoacetate decarboxylase family protein [Bradyrhizobium sp. CIAT3101]|uniref:acetoacetate decarboxylase family protein n=1 Tax=Bradyrhizobium sp. CIAT3101 TaxID=439387 RepID=UPI0024B0EC6F|nr:acetoacetate decarboxylase family protein [Bradyrhizobium sp. CIAT3101]WFU82485.1 acetoacetate decarboxylase family protein [Bradyrhizobium sp. CIAT3101]
MQIRSSFTPPFAPRGRAAVAPFPPWHYAADFLTVAFEAPEARVAEILPPGLAPDARDGAVLCTASFAAWQASTDEGEEFLDPSRSQYNECLVFVGARLGDQAVFHCPYIYVDSDLSMVRGWLLGYPKKFGVVHTTRAFPLTSPAAPSLGPSGRFGGTLALHGRRLAEGTVAIETEAEPEAPVFGSKPIIARRHFASLYEGEHDRPAVDELTRLHGENFQISQVWAGAATLAFGASPTEDLDLLAPMRVLRGYRYSVAMTNKFNTKVRDLRQAS